MVSPATRAVGKASSTPLTLRRPPPARKKPPLADVTPVGKKKKDVGWWWSWGAASCQPPPGAGCRAAAVAFGSALLLRPVKRSEGSSLLCSCYLGPPKSL